MAQVNPPDDPFEFPCEHGFKVFGDAADQVQFGQKVLQVIQSVVPVKSDAVQLRPSSKGRYVCVTISARVSSRQQLEDIYTRLRSLEGLRYLL